MPNLAAADGGCSAVDATGTGRGVLDFDAAEVAEADGAADGVADGCAAGGWATGGAAAGAAGFAGAAVRTGAAISTSVHE
jgi:hypothetical protein